MPFRLQCPEGHRLKVPRKFAGRTIPCPRCGSSLEVPKEVGPPPVGSKRPEPKVSTATSERSKDAPSKPRSVDPPLAVDSSTAPLTAALPEINIQVHASEETIGVPKIVRGSARRKKNEKRGTAIILGLGLIIVAGLFSLPAIRQLIHVQQSLEILVVDGWVPILLLVSVIQIAFAAYSIQLPDWSSIGATAVFLLLVTGFFSAALAICMFAPEQNSIIQSLGLADEQYHGSATRWCFLSLCMSLLLAFLYGQFCLRWRKAWLIAGDV